MNEPHERTLTVNQFCAVENISRSALYGLWKQGRGPKYYLNGSRRRIPHSARIEWQREQMAASERTS